MRTSVLARSVIAVATLAVGSAALAATPATAATPNGVTRDQVLTAANGVRAAAGVRENYSPATVRAMRAIVVAGCDASDASPYLGTVKAATAGDDADGLIITAQIDTFSSSYQCTIGAFAATDTSSTLSGTARITGTVTYSDFTTLPPVTTSTPIDQTSTLSGDAYVTPSITTKSGNFGPANVVADATATGSSTKTTTTTTTVKVKVAKTANEKKAAKSNYSKRLAQAKKRYAKALAKAGRSKSKKAASKRVYVKARTVAKATYRSDTAAGFKNVDTTNTVTDVRAFDITTATPAPVAS
jgi:hypothetical protein